MHTIFFISFLTALCGLVWCVIALEQVLVWDSFTVKHGQLQFGTALHLSTVSFRCVLSVQLSQTGTSSNAITHQTTQNLWLYTAVVLLMMGANST
jgi:hypothetical protein